MTVGCRPFAHWARQIVSGVAALGCLMIPFGWKKLDRRDILLACLSSPLGLQPKASRLHFSLDPISALCYLALVFGRMPP